MPLYPEIEPYEHGLLDVGDSNFVYWEVCGNPLGKPALVLHGGLGSQRAIVQCKHWPAGAVGDPVLRDLYGTLTTLAPRPLVS